MNQDFLHTVEQAARSVRKRYRGEIRNAVILGSGLGEAAGGASSGNEMVSIPFSDIKGFPGVRVEGHAGILKISAGTAFLLGRFHFYEGHTMQQVMLPVFVLHKLGVKRLIITNAAGSLRKDLKPGTIVLIRDHLNIFGISPFKGLELGSLGPRFISMENAYSACLAGVVGRLCPRVHRRGVYVFTPGPQYETPMEAKMLRKLGGDMVGMSTVPEVIAARFLGMEVIGFSCITNYAAGVTSRPVRHENVLEVSKNMTGKLQAIIKNILTCLDTQQNDR
ncbi:MAG: purine-nucleoside phosphorylase [Spirochaetia bacterium]